MQVEEYNLIKREVLTLTGIDLNFYKDAQMQRRLNTFLLRSKHDSWQNYFRAIRTDSAELRKLKDYLTINVSSFFRDTEKYKTLKEKVLPELLDGHPRLRVWSAGCSRGQEPYSIAMLLAELTGDFRRHYILATDLDRSALDIAQAGGPYTDDDVAHVAPAFRQQYFLTRDGKHWVSNDLKRRITFRQQNLLADRFETNFDLIICRNVVIYFTAPVKDKLYQDFYRALRPGGVLFVGGTEIVPKATTLGFRPAGISFYRRNGKI
ncbi:MAG: protein-glutamate O-methyltransferase CheR [Chloroflexi bacterium]|nr:MAG: protein-glutamate O-methyltransferase CheR [Chloroflexota bacterium]